MMTKIKMMSAIMLALAMTALPAMARMSKPDISFPSARNSGAGIPGLPGDEDGVAVQPGAGLRSSATMTPSHLSVSEQDAANIPSLPGTEAGPALKAPSQLRSAAASGYKG
jgi:hypothetical protein